MWTESVLCAKVACVAEPSITEIVSSVVAAGFSLDTPYCDPVTMRNGVRKITPFGELPPLDADIRAALLENLRLVILHTAIGAQATDSLQVQSRLRRWELLRQASPRAADAYVAVLTLFQLEVPECLLEKPN